MHNTHAETVLKNGLPNVYRTRPFSGAALLDQFSFYIGLRIFFLSVFSSMNCPRPQLVWKEIRPAWYLRKLERLADRVSVGEEGDRLEGSSTHRQGARPREQGRGKAAKGGEARGDLAGADRRVTR